MIFYIDPTEIIIRQHDADTFTALQKSAVGATLPTRIFLLHFDSRGVWLIQGLYYFVFWGERLHP